MARAESGAQSRGGSSSSRVLSSSSSFRSATSYASFKSCNSFKSTDGLSRGPSFKSMTSHGTSFYSTVTASSKATPRYQRSVSDVGRRDSSLEGVDNMSFFSFDGEELHPSLTVSEPRVSISVPGEEVVDSGKEGQGHRIYLGYLLVFLASLLHSASPSLLPLLSRPVDPWLLLLVRGLLQIVLSLPLLIHAREMPLGHPRHRGYRFLMFPLAGALLLALHLTLDRLPGPEAGALLGLAPLLTILLARLIAREHLGLLRLLILVLLLGGVVLLSRPDLLFPDPDQNNTVLTQYNAVFGLPLSFNSTVVWEEGIIDPLGLGAGLTTPLLSALLMLLASRCMMGGDLHPVLPLLSTSLGITLISTIGLFTRTEVSLLTLQQIPPLDWAFTLLVAFLGCLATLFLFLALAWVPPGKAAILSTSSLLFSYALQLALSQELAPAWLDLTGAACITLALICTGLEGRLTGLGKWV